MHRYIAGDLDIDTGIDVVSNERRVKAGSQLTDDEPLPLAIAGRHFNALLNA